MIDRTGDPPLPEHQFEYAGTNRTKRKYVNVSDRWHRDGTHVHGNADDFAGRSTLNKYQTERDNAIDPCGAPPAFWPALAIGHKLTLLRPLEVIDNSALAIGWTINEHTHPVPLIQTGIAFNGAVTELTAAPPMLQTGIAFGRFIQTPTDPVPQLRTGLGNGFIVHDPDVSPPLFQHGLALGVGVVELTPAPPILLTGLALGVGVVELTPAPPILLTGLALGGEITDPTSPPAKLVSGLSIGTSLKSPTDPTQEVLHGLALGAKVVGPDEASLNLQLGMATNATVTEIHAGPAIETGIAIGNTVGEEEPDVPPLAGADCAHAGTLTLGSAVTKRISHGQVHWLKFPASAFSTYHVNFTVVSGSILKLEIYSGTSCSGLSLEATNTPPAPCVAVLSMAAQNFYLKVFGPTSGGGQYTMTADTGGCGGGP